MAKKRKSIQARLAAGGICDDGQPLVTFIIKQTSQTVIFVEESTRDVNGNYLTLLRKRSIISEL